MSFTLDTKAQSTEQGTDPVTMNYTCGSGTKLLVLLIHSGNTMPRSGAPTYNGVAFSACGITSVNSGEDQVEIWYMLNPPTGSSYVISAANFFTPKVVMDALSFKCTKNYILMDVVASATGSTANPSMTMSIPSNNELIVSGCAHAYRTPPTQGSGYTLGFSWDFGNWGSASEYKLDSGTSGSAIGVSYVCTADAWGILSVSFIESDVAPKVVDAAGLWAQRRTSMVITSSGSLYAFYSKGSTTQGIKKSGDGGQTWVALSDLTSSTVFGTNYEMSAFQTAIDGNGYIHCIAMDYYTDAVRVLAYSRLNTANDTWDSWVEPIATSPSGMPGYRGCAISIDANNKPHIIYNDYAAECYYSNKISGSWATKKHLGTAVNIEGGQILCHHDKVLVAYNDYSNAVLFTDQYTPSSDTWQGETQFTGVGYADSQARAAAAMADSSGSGFVYSVVSGNGVYENGVRVGGFNVYTYECSICILNDVKYLFYCGTDRRIKLVINDGSGWGSPIDRHGGLNSGAVVVNAYNFQNQESRVNYLYYTVGAGICFSYYQSPNVKTSKSAYIKGAAITSGVQHAYLNSGTYIAGVQHAYMKGAYDALIPDGDISTSGQWQNELAQTSGLYQSIDEYPIPDDSDYVVAAPPVNSDYYECRLSDPIGPIGAGTISIKFRGRNNTSGSIATRVQLRQGSMLVATRDQVLPSTPTNFNFDLTPGEKATITDPTDLRLRFIVLR